MPKPLSHNGLVLLRLRDSDCRTTYSQLLCVAKEKGYSRGWVAHKFREIFNGWPKPRAAVEPQEPEPLLREWLGIVSRRFRAKKKREELRLANMGDRVPMRNDNDMGAMGTRCSADGELVGSPLMTAEDWDWVA